MTIIDEAAAWRAQRHLLRTLLDVAPPAGWDLEECCEVIAVLVRIIDERVVRDGARAGQR
jgi:hypothetical protein